MRADSILLEDVQPTGLAAKEAGSMKSSVKGDNSQPWAPTWQENNIEANNSYPEDMKDGRGIQIIHTVLQTSKHR